MAKQLTYNATIVNRTHFTPELAVFEIRHDDPVGPTASFLPGQYLALGLNHEGHPELGSVRRSMSIASAPQQGSSFQFYIRFVDKPASADPFTHLLWKTKVGDPIFMNRKPVGMFTIADTMGNDDARLKLFVAAGTGLAPFLSMVRAQVLGNSSPDLSKVVLLHGASYASELGFRDELCQYRDQHGLHYFPTISRPEENSQWHEDTGRVEDFFEPQRLIELENKLGLAPGELTPNSAGVLICGLQGTIGTAIARLLRRAFVPDNRRIREALEISPDLPPSIWWEQYDTTPVVNIKDPAVVAELREAYRSAS